MSAANAASESVSAEEVDVPGKMSVGSGCMAALEAERLLAEEEAAEI